MPDPRGSPPSDTLDALVGRPLLTPTSGGGVGPTLGEDVETGDKQAEKTGRGILDEQMRNVRRPPLDGQVRGGCAPARPLASEMKEAGLGTDPGPGPTPGAPVPPATDTDVQNGDH